MAKLDQILLKYSSQNDEEFLASLKGTNPKEVRPSKIEAGELVVHQKSGYFELWHLDSLGEPSQVAVDIAGVIPEWETSNLERASLGELGDVDVVDGNAGGLTSAEAGYLLTWDGVKWVARTAPGFEDGVLPTLNNVGDVNYAWSADTGGALQYVPNQDDLLLWKYNPVKSSYEWAPIPFKLENMPNLARRSGRLVLDRGDYNAIVFGNLVTNLTDSAGVGTYGIPDQISLKASSFSNQETNHASFSLKGDGDGELTLSANRYIALRSSSPGQINYGFRWTADNHPPQLPDYYHVPSMFHVRSDWSTHSLQEISDVNTTNLFAGAVLIWDGVNSEWKPGLGPAPDLSSASINELADVSTTDKGIGKSLIWDDNQNRWTAQNPFWEDITPPYFEFFPTGHGPDRETVCKACNEDSAGSITVVGNIPYICLKRRDAANSISNGLSYGWVKILLDGYNSPPQGGAGPAEYRPRIGYYQRLDPLSEAAYEGSLGSLYNVSTANVFPGSTIVYNPNTFQFEIGYPALNLGPYSISELGDVDATDASVGYGLLWNGTEWEASSLEQTVRLDDLQDVQFGQLGVSNTKLVGAWMLVDGDQTNKEGQDDLSPSLSVSTQKADAAFGTTLSSTSPDGHFYTDARYFGVFSNWTLAQKLDNYVRWNLDNSWQEIPGDGCIEIFFYPTQLLGERTILRKESSVSAAGGYVVRLTQSGELQWQVQGPTGYVGFTITSPTNFVSINNWHHLAITREVNTNRLYLDGALVGSATSVSPWTGDGKFVLGRNDLDDNNTLTHHFFRGYMQDLRVTRGRAKYTGNTLTIPTSLENELVDTTPTAGDFLSYDGTKWTNVDGVTADISVNSITELSDVDTTTQNPVTGDALVWTGTGWEPGIPGVGASWALDDFSDVSTYYQAATPQITFDQAELIQFSTAFQTANDSSYVAQDRSTATMIGYYDDTFTCDNQQPGRDGNYGDSKTTYVAAQKTGQVAIRGERVTIQNKFHDCSFIPLEYHEDTLHYQKCPDRSYDGPAGGGDITGNPEETYIPCWGVIQDHMNDLLPYGTLQMLGNVSSAAPTNGQALVWDAANNIWKPSSNVAADVSQNSINDLNDVDAAAASVGQVMIWDGSAWKPGDQLDSIFDVGDITSTPIVDSTISPHRHQSLKDVPTASPYQQGGSGGSASSKLIDFGDLRGFTFAAHDSQGARKEFLLYGAKSQDGTTVLTSPFYTANDQLVSHIEVNARFIRISDAGHANCGSSGFRLAEGWRLIYEDSTTSWAAYTLDAVPHKGAIQDYLDIEFANLDLSPNILDDLGNVDTQGKANGYALVWDNANSTWIASASIAADISSSTIGQLSDVTKTDNTDALTNDGSVSFDVGALGTSRPWRTDGGLRLINQNEDAFFGWSSTVDGAPLIENNDTFVRVENGRVFVDANSGLVYEVEPSLSDNTIPAWNQVKQQIVRQATDYTALFFLNGNTYTEQNYGWPYDTVVTTTPNPVYFSKFGGEYSYEFRKSNSDRLTWTTADGMPELWNTEVLCSFEFLFYLSSADSGDGDLEFLMAPAGNGSSNYTGSGTMSIGIAGSARSTVFVVFGSVSSTQAGPYGYTATANLDAWNHIVVQNEGSGRWRGYLNGSRFFDRSSSSAVQFPGGITFGGRQNTSASNKAGYLSGFIDDIRITKSWIPYTPNTTSIPIPVQPLEGQGWREVYGSLSQLSDVDTYTTAPTHGQVLTWDNLSEQWKPGTGVAYDVSSNSITDLNDVDTTNSTPSQDDILRWDGVANEWRRSKVDGNGGVRPLVARSATPGQVPSAGNLFAGELYLNMADRVMYALDSAGTAFAFAQSYDRVVGGTF